MSIMEKIIVSFKGFGDVMRAFALPDESDVMVVASAIDPTLFYFGVSITTFQALLFFLSFAGAGKNSIGFL
jgi:hypothetical protein